MAFYSPTWNSGAGGTTNTSYANGNGDNNMMSLANSQVKKHARYYKAPVKSQCVHNQHAIIGKRCKIRATTRCCVCGDLRAYCGEHYKNLLKHVKKCPTNHNGRIEDIKW
eukprot:406850_1